MSSCSWIDGLKLSEAAITPESRVFSRHFRDRNVKNIPSVYIGEKFGSHPSTITERGKRHLSREAVKKVVKCPRMSSCSSTPRSSTPISTPVVTPDRSAEWSEIAV